MSLDVFLNVSTPPQPKKAGSGIFVREGGQTKEISAEEWEAKHPGCEPVRMETETETETCTVFSANITHNLNTMANAAGIYQALWRPEEIGITTAGQLVPLLRAGLGKLRADPEKFEALNPCNGWGSYDGFVPWVANYLDACEQYPDAEVSVSR